MMLDSPHTSAPMLMRGNLDAEFAADYESVRKVLKVGEAFCQDADLAFSQAQSNKPMRGTTKRDGQDVDTRW